MLWRGEGFSVAIQTFQVVSSLDLRWPLKADLCASHGRTLVLNRTSSPSSVQTTGRLSIWNPLRRNGNNPYLELRDAVFDII